MAAAGVVGLVCAAVQLLAPGDAAFVGLYAAIVTAVGTVVRTVRRKRPPAAWVWWSISVAICLVGLGATAFGVLEPQLATGPAWFLVPGLMWVGSYAAIVVSETGIVTRQWGGRPDRATVVDALVVSVAVMVPSVALAASAFAVTPGPLVVRALTSSYVVLDGLVLLMLAQLLLNGDRRNPSLWFLVSGTAVPVVTDYAAVLLRSTVDIRYLAAGWIVSYVLLVWTIVHPGMPQLTERAPARPVRLDKVRVAILSLALFAVPMTVVLGGGGTGLVATVALLAASGTVAVLVLLRLTWLFRDTEEAKAAVEATGRYFRALVQNIGDVILVVDVDGRVQYRSSSAGRVFGYGEDDERLTAVDLVHDEDRPLAEELFARSLERPGELVTGQVRARHRDGSLLWLELTMHNLLADADVGNLVIACHDVTERRLLEDQLRQEAHHDALTGLPNRVLAFQRLDRLIRRAAQGGTRVGVLFADLDNFKAVNDSLGHGAGDELLRGVAERLVDAVRPQDTVARLGGDEFVLLVEMPDETGFEEVAARVVDALSEPVRLTGREVWVTVSVGLAVGAEGETGEDVLRNADVALYRAKHAGRNAYAVYRPGLDGESTDQIDLATDLRRALADGDQLRVHFQPIVELDGGRVTAVEALVRWQHPQRGLLLPASFVPLAEENGLIVPLGQWVLEEACRQVAACGRDDLEVAVNLSGRQLEDDRLVPAIVAALGAAGLAPSRLTLELTESVLMGEDATVDRLRDLKALGVGLAVDDFGTGYSSLAYLQRFPIDTLKVDRQFVAAMATDEHAAVLTRGVVELARTIGLHTVAEGVEEEEQARLLRTSGCELAQGFLFARPGPLQEVLAVASDRGCSTVGAETPAG